MGIPVRILPASLQEIPQLVMVWRGMWLPLSSVLPWNACMLARGLFSRVSFCASTTDPWNAEHNHNLQNKETTCVGANWEWRVNLVSFLSAPRGLFISEINPRIYQVWCSVCDLPLWSTCNQWNCTVRISWTFWIHLWLKLHPSGDRPCASLQCWQNEKLNTEHTIMILKKQEEKFFTTAIHQQKQNARSLTHVSFVFECELAGCASAVEVRRSLTVEGAGRLAAVFRRSEALEAFLDDSWVLSVVVTVHLHIWCTHVNFVAPILQRTAEISTIRFHEKGVVQSLLRHNLRQPWIITCRQW